MVGEYRPLTSGLRRQLWWRGGLCLAVYIVAFNWALRLTAASHVALYLGASPVWTLLWEELRRGLGQRAALRSGVAGIVRLLVLFWPALQTAKLDLLGELLGLAASILWATFSHQMRILSAGLSGAEVRRTRCGCRGLR